MMARSLLALLFLGSAIATSPSGSTCADLKSAYKAESCCGNPEVVTGFQVVPKPNSDLFASMSANPCEGKKPSSVSYFDNENCTAQDGVAQVLEQAGANVTLGYRGQLNATGRVPITTSYFEAGLCPVNVHWHLGTEHYSVGQYDENGDGPVESGDTPTAEDDDLSRRAGSSARLGFRCSHYDATDSRFLDSSYEWKHCSEMLVGETYEVHWPHSAAGACGTPNQYQTPFYDGVFCNDGIISLDPLNTYQKIGVQAQIFTIINDEDYYYPDLMRGMIIEGAMGTEITKYTGSTTGTSRDNEICSKYTPITWQVDRTCHLISASSFDKMCADMKQQRDDMSGDTHPHGSRTLVADFIAADNQQRRSWFPSNGYQMEFFEDEPSA